MKSKLSLRVAGLVMVAGFLLGGGSMAQAGMADIPAAAESAKEEAEAAKNNLFGPSGTLRWLVKGIVGPVGAPDFTAPLDPDTPSVILDAETYVSVDGEDEALDFDREPEPGESLTPYDIQMKGYLRNVATAEASGIDGGLGAFFLDPAEHELQAAITSSGAIYAEASDTGDNGYAESIGIALTAILLSVAEAGDPPPAVRDVMTHQGTIFAKAAGQSASHAMGIQTRLGVWAGGGVSADSTDAVANSGKIFAAAAGGRATAQGMSSQTIALIFNGGSATAGITMDNSGTLHAVASGDEANADGMLAQTTALSVGEGDAATSAVFENSGTIYAGAASVTGSEHDFTSGIAVLSNARAEGGGHAEVENRIINSGTLYVEDSGGEAEAFGIFAETSGPVTEGGDATALNHLENSGTIYVKAVGDAALAHGMGSGIIQPQSVTGNVSIENRITNTGTVHAVAEGEAGKAYGIYTSGDGSITNTGTMVVNGAGGAGIRAADGEVAIANPGWIYPLGGVRTLEVGFEDTTCSAALTGDFRVVFTGDPGADAYAAPILLLPGNTLNLNGARLVASLGETVYWDTPYGIIENQGGTVQNAFGALEADVPNPNIEASWSGADNGENAAVSFSYRPRKSTAAAAPVATLRAAAGAVGLIQNRMGAMHLAALLNPERGPVLLADAGTVATDAAHPFGRRSSRHEAAVFVRPYLTTADQPADGGMGYETAALGFVAGYERALSPSLKLGVHGGAGQVEIDFTGSGYRANGESLDLFSLGAHGAYTRGRWHLQGSTTLYGAWHEYDGRTGLGLNVAEEDSYQSYGAETALTAGWGVGFGRFAFMPEAGVAHSWLHGASHTTNAEVAAWRTRYGSYDEHVVKSILGARLMGTWEVGGARVTPALGLRWEEALGDHEIALSQSLPGTNRIRVSEDLGDTSIVADASLAISRERLSVAFSLMREENGDYTARGGSVTFRWAF